VAQAVGDNTAHLGGCSGYPSAVTDVSTRAEERRTFDIGPCVGVGGFGEVYQATMTSGGGVRTKVALKVLHHGLDPRSQAVQRLADEAKLLGLLNHPSILRIHDLVLLDQRITLVTEYVAGADLDRCTADSGDPMPARAVLQVVAQIAAALHAAYQTEGPDGEPLRLLHRDIKPSNVRVGQHGEVKLLDFGIAKAAGERVAKTQTNALIGSFTYMSPERLDKEGNDDAPGDVFALGCTLYEALQGEELFDGTIRELYRLSMDEARHQAHVEEKVATLPIADEVKAVVREMLAYEADDRPTAFALAERLEDLADDIPGLTLSRWCRGHSWPEPGEEGGALSGRTLTEAALSGATLEAQLTQEVRRPSRDKETFSFDPDPDPVDALPPEPKRRRPWGVAIVVLLLGLLLGGGGAALALVGGVAFLAPWSLDGEGPVDIIEVDDPRGEPSDEVDEVDGVDATGDGQRPAPGPGPRPAPAPADGSTPAPVGEGELPPEGEDGVADAAAEAGAPAGTGVARCGEPLALEPYAMSGRLGSSKVSCLARAMVASDLSQVDRDTLGRLLLVDATARCQKGDCADYETHQRTFFEEVTRSDADMAFGFAQHLAATATDDARRAEALLWSNRALELKSAWKGATHLARVSALNQLRAEVAYQRFEGSPKNEKLRVEARNHAVEWMNHQIQLGRSHAQPLALCASVEGSESACLDRAHDVGATYVVTFVSVPLGAAVFVDGQQVGTTPHQADLKAGSYEVRMEEGGASSSQTIAVDSEQPTRWSWNRRDDAWASTL